MNEKEIIEYLMLEIDCLFEYMEKEDIDDNKDVTSFIKKLQKNGFTKFKPYQKQSKKEKEYIKNLVELSKNYE